MMARRIGGAMAEDWARPVVRWEIEALDPERQRAFYGELFNWAIGDGPIMAIPAGIGGPQPGPGGHIPGGERSRGTLYVQGRDPRESPARAAQLRRGRGLGPLRHPG